MNHPLVSYPRAASTPASHLPFSSAVGVGDLIFVSGQASVDETGTRAALRWKHGDAPRTPFRFRGDL